MPVTTDLLELQQVDLQIMRDRKAIDEIPQAEQIKEVRGRLKELSKKTTKIVGLLKDARIEVEDNDGRRRTLSARVEEVKRDSEASDDFRLTRSYKAELERLEGLYRQAASIKTQLEAKEAELVEAFKKSAGALREDLTRLVARRETLQQAIPADLLERYRVSCAQHNLVGICKLEDHMCTGCRVELQQSQYEQLIKGDSLAVCPVCGRMMVVHGA